MRHFLEARTLLTKLPQSGLQVGLEEHRIQAICLRTLGQIQTPKSL